MQMPASQLAELYEQCVRGQGLHQACEQFFQLFRPTLERIVFRVAMQFGSRQEADDVIQEVSLKFIEKDASVLAGLPREPSASLAYFSVVAANAARDFFRSRRAVKRGLERTISLDAALDSITEGGSSHPERLLLLAQIEKCLPDDRKTQSIFRLYYRQGFSAKEIASIPGLELTMKGVESLIRRATLHIRQKLAAAEKSILAGSGTTGSNPS
jgi:RNA polymerase sigma-70 factor, ECF subfamily